MTAERVEFLEFAWVWNATQGLGTPPVHRRIARWLQARWEAGDRRLLLMAFRGCGKSTLVGLYCAWWLLRAPDTRILVLAADQELAVKMVATVRRVLERHPLCRELLPDAPESWAMDRFTVRRRAVLRDPSMLAQGLAGNITGARADLIVCDDIEVAGNCDTPAKRDRAALAAGGNRVRADPRRHHPLCRHAFSRMSVESMGIAGMTPSVCRRLGVVSTPGLCKVSHAARPWCSGHVEFFPNLRRSSQPRSRVVFLDQFLVRLGKSPFLARPCKRSPRSARRLVKSGAAGTGATRSAEREHGEDPPFDGARTRSNLEAGWGWQRLGPGRKSSLGRNQRGLWRDGAGEAELG
ncbi:MAG TPA: phage terminase large subunit, partial [Acetobacteraceae bacterium]|nr:phage terminase large subunit [Acetobacteraceae bacterium]